MKFTYQEIVKVTNAQVLQCQNTSGTLSISTDSRNINLDNVYLPLKGEKFDGHNFIKDAVEKHDNDSTIIFVTSGVNLSGFICFAYNIEPNENIPFPLVPSCSPIGFDYDKTGNTDMPKYFK